MAAAVLKMNQRGWNETERVMAVARRMVEEQVIVALRDRRMGSEALINPLRSRRTSEPGGEDPVAP